MNLLVLDFSQNSTPHKQLLLERPWKTIWATPKDFESACGLMNDTDFNQILIIEPVEQNKSGFVSELQKAFPGVTILVVSGQPCSEELWQGSVRKLSFDVDSHSLITELNKGFEYQQVIERHFKTWQMSKEGFMLDPRFCSSIDLFHVIDRMFAYFSQKVLCEDIHWIFHRDLDIFLKDDLAALSLELEVDYKKSHRLRSLNEQNPAAILNWIRELPLEKFDKNQIAIVQSKFRQHLWLPVVDQGRTLGFLLFRGVENSDLEMLLERMEEALLSMSRFVSFAIQMWETQNLTLIDDLTDLHNQRYLPRALDREIARAKRLDKKFTMLFLDVDFFKKVNDSSGHWVGSRILVEIGKLFRESLRSCDYAFRYGGDEFVAILVDSDAVSSQVVAERLRKKIEGHTFVIDNKNFNVTVSIGLACYPDHAGSRQEIIELADQAMYQGKNKSRNIVHVAS